MTFWPMFVRSSQLRRKYFARARREPTTEPQRTARTREFVQRFASARQLGPSEPSPWLRGAHPEETIFTRDFIAALILVAT
jgi:hypothetical protein